MKKLSLLGLPFLFAAVPAHADEIFVGGFAHDVETPITRSGQEGGIDINIGWRSDPIEALRGIGGPSAHVYALVNTGGDTSAASIGISWRIGRQVYFRPGVGIAVHNGPDEDEVTPDRIDFGSRIVFAPEASIGVQLSERASIEASWIHFSHAKFFSLHNPGSDNFGLRLNYRF